MFRYGIDKEFRRKDNKKRSHSFTKFVNEAEYHRLFFHGVDISGF